ncbi:MAG: hypothetical protein KA715_12760 [Xanthomonadaceae bacterium]|nr:hypothetical protein [Xanthomonadaceae bacterium]
MSVGKIKPTSHPDPQSHNKQKDKEGKKQPSLKVIDGGYHSQSHFESRIQGLVNPQVHKDPQLLIRFFQLIGDNTMKFAVFSKQSCLKLYKVAMGLQKKIGKNSRGGIIDKDA